MKIAPHPSFHLKPNKDLNQNLQIRLQNFFEKKSFSEGNFFQNHRNKKHETLIQSRIIKISSKKKMALNEDLKQPINNKKELMNNPDTNSLKKKTSDIQEIIKKQLSKKFYQNIPQDFLEDRNEEKNIDILIEMRNR